MAVRVVVGEPRVIHELDSGCAGLDEEQRRQTLGPVDRQGAITISTRATSPEVTNHFSPLIRHPPSVGVAVVAIPLGSEPASASVTA